MNKLSVIIVFLVCAGHFRVAAQSTTVNYSGGGGSQPNVRAADLTPLANGNTVRIGYFDTVGGFDFTENLGDLDVLAAHWHEYDATSITTIFGRAGSFADTPTSTDPIFETQQIYLWIFRTSGNNAPLADYSNVTEYGLYSSTLNNWIFPQGSATPPGNTAFINSSEVNQAFWGNYSPGNYLSLGLAPVPEPTALGLLAMGFGLFGAVVKTRKR